MKWVVLFAAIGAAYFAGQCFGRAATWNLRHKSEDGQLLIEYALIICLIVFVAIVALHSTGTSVSSILNRIAGEL